MARKHLTLLEKTEVLKKLNAGTSATFLARQYGIARSTVSSIYKKRDIIIATSTQTYCGPGKRKTLRTSDLPEVEKRLYKWFLEQRRKNLPVSGVILKQKAISILDKINGNRYGFVASDGWLQKFKKRYGVRYLKISGEKLSSQPELVSPFKRFLQEKIKSMDLKPDQIYNADESGLYWKLLPGKTYVSSAEKTAPGRKAEKQRITFLACTNASGRHKVKPLVIGKAKNPRPFRNECLPVHYRHSKSAWMTAAIFKDWFHNLFVPEVRNFLRNNDLPLKALLILDNAPSHPPENQLQTSDGSITVIYMPPNVTPLIQPMDQNVIRLTKLFYRKSLLLSIIAAEKENICEAVKEITIKDAVFNLRSAWDNLDGAVIAKCWKNIFESNESFDEEDDIPLSVLRQQDVTNISEDVINLLNHVNEGVTHTPRDIGDWNEDRVLSDIEEAENENDEEDVQLVMDRPTCSVSSKDAVIHFDKIIEWAGHNNTDFSDIIVMKRLQEKAIQINLNLRKSQTKVTNFFPKI